MLGLLTAAASAAAAIVYIAHYGNPNTNWFAICQQYNNFCERISGSLIGSFLAVFLFIILILLSAVAISRNWCVWFQVFMPFSSWQWVWKRLFHENFLVCICYQSVFLYSLLIYWFVLEGSIYAIWNVVLVVHLWV